MIPVTIINKTDCNAFEKQMKNLRYLILYGIMVEMAYLILFNV